MVFSLHKYIAANERLSELITYVKNNSDTLKYDLEKLDTFELSPNFDVITDLLNLLKMSNANKLSNSSKSYSKDRQMTLWSLMFEILGSVDSDKVLKMNILDDLITTLFDSQIELLEISYLSQTTFKVNPNPQFICSILFHILNKSIGTKNEESSYTLCCKWIDLLIYKPLGEETNHENIQVTVHFENPYDIALIMEDISKHLIKNLTLTQFSAVVSIILC